MQMSPSLCGFLSSTVDGCPEGLLAFPEVWRWADGQRRGRRRGEVRRLGLWILVLTSLNLKPPLPTSLNLKPALLFLLSPLSRLHFQNPTTFAHLCPSPGHAIAYPPISEHPSVMSLLIRPSTGLLWPHQRSYALF